MKFLKIPLNLLILVLFASSLTGIASNRPNILFTISDDQSFPHASAYGADWVNTPGFDRVAEMGLLFNRAYTPNAKCAPSRSIILTGRLSWQLEAAVNHVVFFPDKFKTWMEALGDAGYVTGYTGKGWGPGDPGTLHGKLRELTGPLYIGKTEPSPAKGISNKDYAGNFESFLDQRDEDKPFSFWYGGHEPHRRYEYGSGVAKGGKSLGDVDRVPGYWPDDEIVRNDMLDYAFEVEHFDRHLSSMLQSLDRRGLLENTIVIVTSDNGMPFPRSKGNNYEISHHLPLAISWPAGIKNPGRKVESLVSFIDYAPTFLEAAGVEAEEVGMQPITGKSLFPIFMDEVSNPESFREFLLVGKERHDAGRPNNQGYPIRGILEGDYLFLRNFETSRWPSGNPETGYLNTDGGATKTLILNYGQNPETMHWWKTNFGKRVSEEFYNLKSDPDCIVNLAERGDQTIKRDMAAKMYSLLTHQGDLRMFGKGHQYEDYPFSTPAQQDLYERYMAGEPIEAGWVNQSDFAVQPSEMIKK
jgi:N-sulfoglucosamine sulfohydrolase